MVGMFDAKQNIEALQAAVQARDWEYADHAVSERMIWVMPLPDNQRGKRDWIDASFGVTWNWFKINVRRVIEIGDDTRVVESWISQSREPAEGEDATGPLESSGVVLDVWAREGDTWRLLTRHPHRSEE
jgi:hypothetical protein